MTSTTRDHGSSDSVACIVVTRDRKDLLRECLRAVAGQTHRPHHVVMVDNASSDGTRGMVRAEFPAFQIIELARNVGGAGAFYAGMTAAREPATRWLVARR